MGADSLTIGGHVRRAGGQATAGELFFVLTRLRQLLEPASPRRTCESGRWQRLVGVG